MAQAIIDEMVVKLTADVSDLRKQVEEYRKEIEQSDKNSVKAEEEKVKMAKQRSGFLSKSMNSTSAALKGAMGSIAKLIGGLAIIKTVMQGVAKVIDEGRQNLYAYSKLTDGSLSKAMDKRNSAIAEFGNAFAAFESMITEALAPLITKLFEGLADIFNKISQVVAELFNLPGYYQANFGIMKQWSTNLKETRMLLGIDSLTLASPKADDTPVEDQFTYVKNDGSKDGLKSLFDTIQQDALNAITTIQGYITGAFDLIDPSGRLTSIFNNVTDTISGIIRAVLGDEFADGLAEMDFGKMKDGIDKFLEDTGLGGVIDSLVGFIEQFSGAISDIVNSEGFQDFVDMLKSIIEIISGITKTSVDLITDLFKVFRGEGTFEDLWNNFKTNITDALGKAFTDFLEAGAETTKDLAPKEFTDPKGNPAKTQAEKPIIVGSTTYPDAGDGSFSNFLVGSIRAIFRGDWDWFKPHEEPPMVSPSNSKTYGEELDEILVKGNKIGKKAKGGVLTAPTLVWAGEYAGARNNPELITPQNLLDERLQNNNRFMLSAINDMTGNVVNAINDINWSVNIGNESIARAAGAGNQAWYRKTGKSLLN